MNTQEAGNRLVELCKVGKNFDAMKELYSDDIISVEAVRGSNGSLETKGKKAVIDKSAAWAERHQIHGGRVEGPYVADSKFAVVFNFDVTAKASGERMSLEEVGVYTVSDGKIVKEEFLYADSAGNGLAR